MIIPFLRFSIFVAIELDDLFVKYPESEIWSRIKKRRAEDLINKIKSLSIANNSILIKGLKIKTGTIIKRPLNINFFNSLNFNPEYHYAVVLGTDSEGAEWVVDMSSGKDVNIIEKKDFLVDNKFSEKDIEFHYIPDNAHLVNEILKRALYFKYCSYDLLDLNCKVFAEYLVLNKDIPKSRIKLLELQIAFCELYLLSDKDKSINKKANEDYLEMSRKSMATIEKLRIEKTRLLKEREQFDFMYG